MQCAARSGAGMPRFGFPLKGNHWRRAKWMACEGRQREKVMDGCCLGVGYVADIVFIGDGVNLSSAGRACARNAACRVGTRVHTLGALWQGAINPSNAFFMSFILFHALIVVCWPLVSLLAGSFEPLVALSEPSPIVPVICPRCHEHWRGGMPCLRNCPQHFVICKYLCA